MARVHVAAVAQLCRSHYRPEELARWTNQGPELSRGREVMRAQGRAVGSGGDFELGHDDDLVADQGVADPHPPTRS